MKGQNIIAPAGTYEQNFDAIGTSSTASLPTGWKVENITGIRTITNAYTSVIGTATTLGLAYNAAMSSSAGNGIYNFGSGATIGNQAVGGISSGNGSKSVNMFLKLTNSSATTCIPGFTITYSAKRFRNGSNTAGFSIRLYYSTTDTANSWTEITEGALIFEANADNYGSTINPLETKTAKNVALAQSLAKSGSIYFAWSYSVTTTTAPTNAQALGIDDITISAVTLTPTFTQVAAICSGASLAALPITSNNFITGTWSPAINNTVTTTYTFTPTSSQCATTASMTITVNPNPSTTPIYHE